MSIDDECDSYKPTGFPALIRSENEHIAKINAKFMRAIASAYSPMDDPELYEAARKAEEEAKSYSSATKN